ncbi:FCD domain-containing protein [Arthrobacter globiformis]|uniref:FCD domain-containing protein n=1 Tax=Arthrobacter globiformis TaxID=1665 RepID=UPI0027813931|nr:FCD domain-containing protein [Arthrobacter globiformis]MDQ0862887.1 DNA-binding GntR family transcriptional regulator [Arthrobacter globiformis]
MPPAYRVGGSGTVPPSYGPLIQIHAELSPLTWGQAWLDGQPTAVEEHEALLDAIEQGDPGAAENTAIAHFEREGALIINQRLAILT